MAVAAMEQGTAGDVLQRAAVQLKATRPTAVELGAAVDAALEVALGSSDAGEREELLWANAAALLERQRQRDRSLSEHGAALVASGGAVLTHCNTGALATGGTGTALGVIRRAFEQGKLSRCYATETRPLLQGARLTMWELGRLGIPATLLPDGAAASLLASGRVSAVITGADRIAMNGDTANKVGTYGLALAAARHGVPFYIAAPTSTIDPNCESGDGIPIEFRAADEVAGFGERRWAPDGVEAYNPAFDVTPADLIAAIVTDQGVARPSFGRGLAELVERGSG
jgi:methylthioribose-1-phosphate isomerase